MAAWQVHAFKDSAGTRANPTIQLLPCHLSDAFSLRFRHGEAPFYSLLPWSSGGAGAQPAAPSFLHRNLNSLFRASRRLQASAPVEWPSARCRQHAAAQERRCWYRARRWWQGGVAGRHCRRQALQREMTNGGVAALNRNRQALLFKMRGEARRNTGAQRGRENPNGRHRSAVRHAGHCCARREMQVVRAVVL